MNQFKNKISIAAVIKHLAISFFYFVAGCSFGVFAGFILFFSNKVLFQQIIDLFLKRITFGVQYLGSYKIWFILDNLVVIFLMITGILLMMTMFLRKRRPIKIFNRRFRRMQERPKITLFSLYMIPIGALFINGFLISLLLAYTLLNFGFQNFEGLSLILLPHGINEILGLLFSSALGLSYLEVLKPYILSKRWDEAKKIGRQLLFSKTTAIVVVWIVMLIIFSGFLEGSFAVLLKS